MFEGYIESARRTIYFARYEAARLGATEISPEHILLGLLKDNRFTSEVMPGAAVAETQEQILAYLPRLEKRSPPTDLSLSHESQQVLAFAEKEAKGLAHRRVSNYHILLGLLKIKECFAMKVFREKGVSVDHVRRQMSIFLETEPVPQPPGPAASLSLAERRQYELEKRVVRLMQLNDYRGALNVIGDSIADPSLDRNLTTRMLAPIASVLARIVGDLDLVKHYCEQRLTLDPDDPMALYTLADCLALQGDATQASKLAHKSYALSLVQPGGQGKGMAELIENRFPEVKAST
jgi:hypothetical protein